MASLSIARQAACCRFPDQTRPAATLQSFPRCAPIPRAAKMACLRASASSFLPLGDLRTLATPQMRENFPRTKLADRDFAGGVKLRTDFAGGAKLRTDFGAGENFRARTIVIASAASASPYDKGSSGASGASPMVVSSPEDRQKENGSSSPKIAESYDPSEYIRKGGVGSNTATLLMGNRRANMINAIENRIERVIFNCRFLTLLAVFGSLAGSVLCFLKGCLYVSHSYSDYIRACLGRGTHTSRVILYLVEAVDVYLMGTVMLIFGMGLYELFVSSLEVPSQGSEIDGPGRSTVCGSNLFGLFRIRQRPAWLEIRSLDELKTKLGHVIVMILLVGLFEKSKKVIVHTSVDFLCFSASILLSSAALYLLSILHNSKETKELKV